MNKLIFFKKNTTEKRIFQLLNWLGIEFMYVTRKLENETFSS